MIQAGFYPIIVRQVLIVEVKRPLGIRYRQELLAT